MISNIIINTARSYIGTKYHHQGRLKKSATCQGGIDCIGLIMGVAQELSLRSTNGNLLTKYDKVDYSSMPDGWGLRQELDKHFRQIEKSELQIGDIGLFRFIKHPQHVGIISDYPLQESGFHSANAKPVLGLIHCYSGTGKVVEHILTDKWLNLMIAAYRFA